MNKVCLGLSVCLVGCDSGIAYQDRSQGQFSFSQQSSSIEASSQSLSISEPIEISSSRAIVYASITDRSIFLVPIYDSSIGLGEKSYDPHICSYLDQIGASLLISSPIIQLIPSSDLNCDALYALCLSDAILFESDLAYTGSMTIFETESCE